MTTATAPRTRTPAERRPPDEDAPVLLQRRGPLAGRHVGHRRPRRAGADLLEVHQVAQAAIARRRAADRGPRGRQGRRGREVPLTLSTSAKTGARGSMPRSSRSSGASPRDRPARRGRGRRRPLLAQRAGPRARSPAARGRGVPVHETLGYGGTCDLIAELDGEVWLLDWKTGSSVADPRRDRVPRPRLQLAAYANAEFIARVNDPTRYPLPADYRYGILHVTDGGTRLYPAASPRGLDRVPRVPALHGWRRARRRDHVLAIDPGTFRSAWLRFDGVRPRRSGSPQRLLVRALRSGGLPDVVVIEEVHSYGMAVGPRCSTPPAGPAASRRPPTASRSHSPAEIVSSRCAAIAGEGRQRPQRAHRPLRRQAALGRKANPGPLYGISSDLWSALAIAVTYPVQSAS